MSLCWDNTHREEGYKAGSLSTSHIHTHTLTHTHILTLLQPHRLHHGHLHFVRLLQ